MEIKRKTAAGGAAISVFLRSLVCALGFSLLYAVPRGSLQPQAATGFLLWSDALSMSGVLVLLLAGAFRLDRCGTWDWLLYALYQARFLLRRETDQSYTNFSDYKRLRERSTTPLWPWILTGLLWLSGGLLLGMLYYRAL